MLQSLKTLLIVAGIVALWAGSSALYGWRYQFVLPCMSLGVAVCALLLILVSRNEDNWRQLTWQPYSGEQSAWLLFGCLFGLPVMILVGALVTWIGTLALKWLSILALAAPI
ncbi:MAG: hypothetical protein AAF702_41210 [Chloroflexota bacterium]